MGTIYSWKMFNILHLYYSGNFNKHNFLMLTIETEWYLKLISSGKHLYR